MAVTCNHCSGVFVSNEVSSNKSMGKNFVNSSLSLDSGSSSPTTSVSSVGATCLRSGGSCVLRVVGDVGVGTLGEGVVGVYSSIGRVRSRRVLCDFSRGLGGGSFFSTVLISRRLLVVKTAVVREIPLSIGAGGGGVPPLPFWSVIVQLPTLEVLCLFVFTTYTCVSE